MSCLSLLFRVVPLRLTHIYIKYIYSRMSRVKKSQEEAVSILRDIDPMEYTEGFRLHLSRKIDDAKLEQKNLKEKAEALEALVNS